MPHLTQGYHIDRRHGCAARPNSAGDGPRIVRRRHSGGCCSAPVLQGWSRCLMLSTLHCPSRCIRGNCFGSLHQAQFDMLHLTCERGSASLSEQSVNVMGRGLCNEGSPSGRGPSSWLSSSLSTWRPPKADAHAGGRAPLKLL